MFFDDLQDFFYSKFLLHYSRLNNFPIYKIYTEWFPRRFRLKGSASYKSVYEINFHLFSKRMSHLSIGCILSLLDTFNDSINIS